MKIDVCIPTWNADKCIMRCLDSVKRELDIHRIIIADKFSTDHTLEIVQKYPKTKVIHTEGNLAIARQILIENVTTDFFLFIDADVELKPNFMSDIKKYLTDDVGAIASMPELTGRTLGEKYHIELEKIKGNKNKPIDITHARGFTYCTFIRKNAVEKIKIPIKYYAREDNFIKDYVMNGGFKWIIPKERLCIHYNEHGSIISHLKMESVHGREYRDFNGEMTIPRMGYYILKDLPMSIRISWRTKNPFIAPYIFLEKIFYIYGHLFDRGNTYLDRKNER